MKSFAIACCLIGAICLLVALGIAIDIDQRAQDERESHFCSTEQWRDAYALGYEQGFANAVTEFKKEKH